MKKLDRKGYAITLIVFGILVVFLVILGSLLVTMNNSVGLNKILKQDIIESIETTDSVKEKVWNLSEDNDLDNKVSKGDLICISTECFYVISNDGNNIRALSKYNLYVGGSYDKLNQTWVAYGEEATGFQSEQMKGSIGEDEDNGTTAFSTKEIHGVSYTDFVGSIAEGYVNNYVSKLNEMNANIKESNLITIEDLVSLGCDEANNLCNDAISWVYLTSYWTSSVASNGRLMYIYSGGEDKVISTTAGTTYTDTCGIRPVVTIPVLEF